MGNNKLWKWSGLAVSVLLFGCAADNDTGGITGTGYDVQGSAQKGPYLLGSTVNVSRLNEAGGAIEGALTTETTDSLGNFGFQMDQAGPIQIKVDGYHFNELTAKLSSEKLTLNAVAEVVGSSGETAQTINVNMLTHLINVRVRTLMAEGIGVKDAISQAEAEWLVAFDAVAEAPNAGAFDEAGVYVTDETGVLSDNYLLFVTATFYQYAEKKEDGALAEILNSTAADFGDDGLLNGQDELIDSLLIAATELDAEQIKSNLEELSQSIVGRKLVAADISDFLTNLIITSPAEGQMITSESVQIRVLGVQHGKGITYSLYVDGEKISELPEGENSFTWYPYFWSENGPNIHTLIIEASLGGKTIQSNLVNVEISSDLNSILAPVSPVSNAIQQDTSKVEFQVKSVSGAKYYEIEIISVDNISGGSSFFLISGESKTISFVKGEYLWRYRAFDGLQRKGAWSEPYSFVVDGPSAPEENSLISTADPVSVSEYILGVSWAAMPYATDYQVEVSIDSSFDSILETRSTKVLNYKFKMPVGRYYWRVRSRNHEGVYGGWSAVQPISLGLYEKYMGGGQGESAKKIIRSKDRGVVLLGSTKSSEISDGVDSWGDDWVVKLDYAGNIEWQYISNAPERPRFLDLIELADDAILLVGRDQQTGKAVAAKLSDSGEVLWENQYKPENMAEDFYFKNIVEYNGSLYISTSTLNLHTISSVSGDVSDPISIPDIDGLRLTEVSEIAVMSTGILVVAGVADPEGSDPEAYGISGAFFQVLNKDLIQRSTWNNVGEHEQLNVASVFELPGNKLALTGQPMLNGLTIAIINFDGVEQARYETEDLYISSSTSSFVGTADGGIIGVAQASAGDANFVAFSPGLILERITPFAKTSYPVGIVEDEDDLLMLISTEKAEGKSDFDIAVRKFLSRDFD